MADIIQQRIEQIKIRKGNVVSGPYEFVVGNDQVLGFATEEDIQSIFDLEPEV